MITINPQTQKLQAVASKDETRYNITGISCANNIAVSTNGHILALRQLEENESLPNSGSVTRINKPSKNTLSVSESDSAVEVLTDTQFPDINLVTSTLSYTHTLTLDARLLAVLAEAIYKPETSKLANKHARIVTLAVKFESDGRVLGPITVIGNDDNSAGVIMPCRIDENKKPDLERAKRLGAQYAEKHN